MLNWPVSGLFALAALDRRAVVLMALEYRKLWRNTLKAEDLVGTSKPDGVVTTQTTDLGGGAKAVESVVTPAAAKPRFKIRGRSAA
jgi:hypothetical protein